MTPSARLPSGLVTFVFTDIEGSTRLFRRIGGRYPALLERHREILRAAWVGWGGFEVSTEGDAFFVAFTDAAAAIEACAEAQRALTREPWPADGVIKVRMGLHTGLASPDGNGYIAFAVHQAARVVNAGHGGQIVATAYTVAQASGVDDLTLVSAGRYRVRDFDEPVELFEVVGAGLPRGFPSLRVLPADRHNLVASPTTIVGRDSEVETLAQHVASARLVSVVGPGGLGKTRLVTEYGIRHADDWDHGVWLVDLAPLGDPALVADAVADAIGASITGGVDARAAVVEHLRDRRALLIMDNCEHITVSVARHVADLLGACPTLTVVATSREPLGLRGERVWRLPALSPDVAGVELFCDRAGLGADLDPSQQTTIAELCRVLDGLPLAIELAAARCDVLSPEEILKRLGRRRDFLRSDDPTLSARQRSLDETIGWSHQLLGSNEQSALRRLAAFAGGFGLEAAVAAVTDRAVDAYDVPELVWSLVSKSLVVSEPAAGSTRYRMLETIRAFAERRLAQSGEHAAVALGLGRFFVKRYGPQVEKVDADLLAERALEVDNLRALIHTVATHDEELAQSLACTVVGEHRRASPASGVDEGHRFLDRLTTRTHTRVGLLAEVAFLAADCGDFDVATDLLDQAQRLADDIGSPGWLDGRIPQLRGAISIHRGNLVEATSIAVTALAEITVESMGRARLLNLLNVAAIERGALEEARQAAESALDICTNLGNLEGKALVLGNLAEIEMRAGHHQAAARRQLEALTLALQLGKLHDVGSALILAARLAASTNEWATATRLQTASDTALTDIGLVLLPSDRALCDEMLAAAANRLGPPLYAREADVGRSLNITEAVDQARSVLTSSAGRARLAPTERSVDDH